MEAGHALPGYTLVRALVLLFRLDDQARLQLLDALMGAAHNEGWPARQAC